MGSMLRGKTQERSKRMASITITTTGTETTYQRIGGGYTGEVYPAPIGGQLPPLVAEAMGLSPWSFDGGGNCVEYALLYPLMNERIVHTAKVEAVAQDEGRGAPTEAQKERNGLVALQVAVQECRCELRSGYVEMKYPATTKRSFRYTDWLRTRVLVDSVEAKKKRMAA
jgi:hypothetical protein